MTRAKRLSRKQLALIEDLFKGESDEQKILEKHKVGRQLYRKWLADDQFTEELDQRVAGAYRQSTFLLAANAPTAAKELAGLTRSKNPETARKACLDIIATNPSTVPSGTGATAQGNAEGPSPISPQTASRLLAVLAGGDSQPQS